MDFFFFILLPVSERVSTIAWVNKCTPGVRHLWIDDILFIPTALSLTSSLLLQFYSKLGICRYMYSILDQVIID